MERLPALAQLPRAGMEAPSLQGCDRPADVALGTCINGGLGAAGGQLDSEGLEGIPT